MRYLGGKSRIAKEIAAIVAPKGIWWEPFCGGLNVSVQLAKYGPGVVSDANPALIALYQAVRDGWVPPVSVSAEEYRAAKLLPDLDPLKAFVGFGCSFGGMWFQHYVEPRTVIREGRPPEYQNLAKSARNVLLRDLPLLAKCHLRHLSFFALDPVMSPCPETIYADPPYQGTAGYSATGGFDHSRFWDYCRTWASRGVRVFVSEYNCPVPATVVWEKSHGCQLSKKRTSAASPDARKERLFRVLP